LMDGQHLIPVSARDIEHSAVWRAPRMFRGIVQRKNMERRGLAPATVRRKLSALSSLFDYLCERNAVTHNPVDGVKRPMANGNEGSTPALGDAQARKTVGSAARGHAQGRPGSGHPGYLAVSRYPARRTLRLEGEGPAQPTRCHAFSCRHLTLSKRPISTMLACLWHKRRILGTAASGRYGLKKNPRHQAKQFNSTTPPMEKTPEKTPTWLAAVTNRNLDGCDQPGFGKDG
jgi:hypothetical protein